MEYFAEIATLLKSISGEETGRKQQQNRPGIGRRNKDSSRASEVNSHTRESLPQGVPSTSHSEPGAMC